MLMGSATCLPQDLMWDNGTIIASAQANESTSGKCGDNINWKLADGTLKISGTGDMYDYDDLDNAPFASRRDINKIIIGEGITSVGKNAFYECRELSSVSLPEGMTEIKENAFYRCSQLSSINIPSTVKTIGPYALYMSYNLLSISLPEGLTKICDQAFAYSSIETVNLPETLTSIGESAFSYSDIKSITIPSSIKTVSNAAFWNCTKLESLTVKSGVMRLTSGAFNGCSGLKSVKLPDTLIVIGSSTFSGCSSLKSISIPQSVNLIGPRAFENSGLTSITLSDNVTSLGKEAFRNCSSLKSAVLPKDLEDIEDGLFYNCQLLESVTMPAKLKTIGEESFYQCKVLKLTDLPSTLTSIGGGAFALCNKIKSIIIPNGVKTLPQSVFSGCIGLESVKLPNGFTEIGSACFEGCQYLSSINIPSSVTKIGDYAFLCCLSIKSITIPSGVTKIDNYTFDTCLKLTEVKLPKNLKTIGAMAFYNCPNLSSIVIPKTVTEIDYKALGFVYVSKEQAYVKQEGFTIKCFKGTSAESYAKDYSIDYALITYVKAKDPTCTSTGQKAHWTCQGKYYNDELLTKPTTKAKVTIEALGHNYSTPTYTWSKDNKTCTAKFVCQNDKSHMKNVTATVTTKTTATCTKAGKTTYTATVKYNGKTYTTSKSVTIKALGHKMGEWKTTSFNVDKKTSVQTRKCTRGDKSETKTVQNAIVRYAGSDRAETATLISNANKGGLYKTANTVVIATGFDFHDALAAVPLASAYNAPLLLADRDNLSAKTLAEIKRLGAKNIIVVATTNAKDANGNSAAIGKNVYNQLKGYKVTKLTGNSYYETAKKVATQLKTKTGKAPTSIFITTDKNYADALSASPVAAILGAPILYVKSTGALNSNTTTYLKSIKSTVKNIYIVGGVNAVSKDVVAKIKAVLPNKKVTRFDGTDRYETCIKINKAFKFTLTGKAVCVVKGYNFPDALAGGVLAAKNKAPLFLADMSGNNATLSKNQSSYLKSKNPSKLYVFGGETAVPTKLVKTIAKASV